MKYTEQEIDNGIKNFKNINPEVLIKKLYPNSNYTIDFAVFRKNGYVGYPTWVIGINRNESFEWRKLITISAHEDFNKEFETGHFTPIMYEPKSFLEELKKSDNWFDFFYDNYMLLSSENFNIKNSIVLNKILNDYEINIFDTE